MDDPKRSLLFTDLYQLTMAQAYHRERMEEPAVFEMYFRTLPPGRNWMVAAGLADCLDWLENLKVDEDDLVVGVEEVVVLPEHVIDHLGKLGREARVERLQESLGRYLYEETRRRPIVEVSVRGTL